jgi:uncharacterized protein YceH (UPF0502 family)
VDILLTEIEARVLGALIEKEIATPDYYPLSLNALVNACNQKSNRDPLMSLDEDATRQALRSLHVKGLGGAADSMDSRVTKYAHTLSEVFNFTRPETAILCELLLRGPQTPGELRSRAERMHHFDELSEVQSTLHRLMKHDPPLVQLLPRQQGMKEARYAHLLSGEIIIAVSAPNEEPEVVVNPPSGDRIARLEQEIARLQKEIADLKEQFGGFRKQFE